MKDNRLILRPRISTSKNTGNISIQESFQNKTLRPIIKIQHDLLVANYCSYLKIKNHSYNSFSVKEHISFIEKSFQKDIQFRSLMIGIISGLYTLEEFSNYKNYRKDINKRIVQIIKKRLIDSVSELSISLRLPDC